MKPSEALTAHRAELRQLVSRCGLSRPRVFGSVVSGTDTDESDLDLLVDPGQSAACLIATRIDAENCLGITVVRLTPNGLPQSSCAGVLQRRSSYEAIQVYRETQRPFDNHQVQDAVVRNIEIIGEAVNKINATAPDFIEQHPESFTGLKYAGCATSRSWKYAPSVGVWKTVKDDFPKLKQQIDALLKR